MYSGKINSSLWLVTCSDLFFLLFAFFVLNHSFSEPSLSQLIQAPRLKLSEIAIDNTTVAYDEYSWPPRGANKDVSYPIEKKWFTAEGELTLFGKTQIAAMKALTAAGAARIEVIVDLPSDDVNKQDLKDLQLVFKLLENELHRKAQSVVFRDLPAEKDFQITIVFPF